MNHIELFAGCGGLSLGLDSVGFKLVLANELSPMASETFAYNFFREDLSAFAKSSQHASKNLKTKWLSSNYEVTEMDKRLREDPRSYPPLGQGHCDIADNGGDLQNTLVVGSIVQFNEWLSEHKSALEKLKTGFNTGGIDLISGGPPCQSFSMAGMREFSNARNILPWEFAKFVSMIQPKFALLENVTGILRPFLVEGKKVYAWFEVAKAFANVGYVPLCLHVNAKFAGVAQNRPRFIMILFRSDVFKTIKPYFSEAELKLVSPSDLFYKACSDSLEVTYGSLPYFDVSNFKDLGLFKNSFLKHLVEYSDSHHSVRDAIDDLKTDGGKRSAYVKKMHTYFSHLLPKRVMKNHDLRNNSPLVRRRFRIYQILKEVSRKTQIEAQALLSGSLEKPSLETLDELLNFEYLMENGALGKFKNHNAITKFFQQHPTRKQTQKALLPDMPAPAALSIPDDACHYHVHIDDFRTLSVREMARIQSFPDNFVFRSKVTTGGQMRKFEVPQYTQVGNAVPPVFGRALAKVIEELINRFNQNCQEKVPGNTLMKNEEMLEAQ